jgi:hypothetical protein
VPTTVGVTNAVPLVLVPEGTEMPDKVQLLAFMADQVTYDDFPRVMGVGLTEILTVGAGVTGVGTVGVTGVGVGVTGVTGVGVVPLQAKPVVVLYPEVEVQPTGNAVVTAGVAVTRIVAEAVLYISLEPVQLNP